MRCNTQFDLQAAVQTATLPPAAWYTSPEIFEREKRHLWAAIWQPVGVASQVARPGQYFTGRFMNRTYVVVRGEDGELRAFHNVCRHHGAELVCGNGNLRKFVCPYHAWTYSLDGQLVVAPGMQGAENFDRACFGLKPIDVCVTGPLIWLALGTESVAPDTAFGDAWKRLALSGYDKLEFHSRRSYEIRCNWKVYVDNYLDGGYHVGMLHKSLSKSLKLRDYKTEVGDDYSIQSVAGRDSRRIGEQALYVWLYPNFMINRYGPVMDTNWVIPLSPDRCLTVFDFYFADMDGRKGQAFVRQSLNASEQVQREDIAICESVQRGLGSGAYEPGRYAPKIEHAMHVFHLRFARQVVARHG